MVTSELVELKILSYIAATIWFYVILRWDVYTDFKKWKADIKVNHSKEAVLRAVLLIPSHILLYWPKVHLADKWYDYLLYAAIVIGLLFTVWWEFFDGWYNKLRNFKWRFNGSIDEDDAFLDKFLYKIGDKLEAVLKLGLILTFLLLYIFVK